MMNHTLRRTALTLAALGAFGLAGCTPKAAAPAAAADTSKDVDGMKAWVTQFNADYKARAADKLAVDNEPTSEGYAPFSTLQKAAPDDAKTTAAQFAADPALNLELKVNRAEVSKGGDLGYVIGDFTRTSTDPKTKKVNSLTGGYMIVLRKQSDGAWKMVSYVASPGPSALAAMSPPSKS